ncbi:MAG: GTPase Era, partial [Acidobacteriota bacterium]
MNDDLQAEGTFNSGYVAFVGAPNVGKSTLLNQILKEKISITAPKPQTTRNRILGILTEPEFQIVFVDTPGVHRARDEFNRMMVDTALASLSEVDAICFIVEATETSRDINGLILENLGKLDTPVILVINKIDLLKDKKLILPIIDHYRALHDFHAVIPISALTGDGVESIVSTVKELLPEGPRYYPEDYITDQQERFIVAEMVRE